MDKNLTRCPCGKTPTGICIEATGQGSKYATVTGTCCLAWQIEFRVNYLDLASPECHDLAVAAWNSAPRGI